MEKNQEPLVSIITPTYNSDRFIERTIKSVRDQTYQNWEMIIIDDYSKDQTVNQVKNYQNKDKRIKLIELNQNSGAAVARNTGINEAKGKFLAFLDSDDLWDSTKLTEQVQFMLDNDYKFSFSDYSIMDKEGNLLNKVIPAKKQIGYHSLLRHPGAIGCLTVMLDRERIDNIVMPNIKTRQDFALWLKILKRGINAYGLNKNLATYRKVPGSISSNKVKAAKKNWYVYRKIENLNIIKSGWYFSNYAIRALIRTIFS
ncbi:glycosyltransferase family 2 protein [Aquibacillus halophilus]|nr:glycosyltransferase family 2 protein [Aquibacillus halophilus]